jgi:hypothetical protein
MWASLGNLVPQILRVVTFAYDLYFRHVISHWKGIIDKYTLLALKYNFVYSLTVEIQRNTI